MMIGTRETCARGERGGAASIEAGDGGGLCSGGGARAYAWRQSGPRRRVAADANGSEMLSALIIYYDQCRYGPAGVAYHGGKLLHR
jgi:hypothetical protein